MDDDRWLGIARWALAYQTLEQRRTLLAWHDTRGEGDAFRSALTEQHEAWADLKTISSRQKAYEKWFLERQSSRKSS